MRAWPALGTTALLVLTSADAAAAPEANEAQIEEAKRLYAQGHEYFVAGRCADAVPLLERSLALVSSPNSRLLVARCLADAGKRVEAVARYADVERDALAAIRNGETRYAETAAAAAKEGADLRAKLAVIRVVRVPRETVALEIDGQSAPLNPSGEASILHEPGGVTLAYIEHGRRRQLAVRAQAGKETTVVYEPEPQRIAPEPPPPPAPSGAVPWTAYAAGGMTIAGVGTFVVFGLLSESTYSDLRGRCAPRCQPADESDADRGRAYQTIANVGLVVGVVFAVATVAAILAR